MQLKKYTLASLVLILMVGIYTFTVVSQDGAALDLWFYKLPYLPSAILVALAMLVLFVASLLHMIYYSFKRNLEDKKLKKDQNTLVDALVDRYLAKDGGVFNYKTSEYKMFGSLVESSKLFLMQDVDVSQNKKLSDLMKNLSAIKNGEVVELKQYKLPITNEFMIQNEKNRYKKGELSAEAILNSSSKYDKTLVLEAFKDFVKKAPLKSIEKHKEFMSKEALFSILARVNAPEDTLIIDNNVLIELFKSVDISKDGYIEATKTLSKHMLPDQRMKLFEQLSSERDFIMDAYFYTLFDLEMNTLARELLNNTQENEYVKFKIYSDLRANDLRYSIENLI